MLARVEQEYVAEVEVWRQAREDALRTPDGWLALTGLFFLEEGTHSVGSAPENAIVLPAGAPANLGTLDFFAQQATLHVQTDVPVMADGAPVRTIRMVDNKGQSPTLVTVGSVAFFIHHVGEHYAVRVRDAQNPAIAAFAGCRWFPVNVAYRVQGRFVAHDAPRDVPIDTYAGVGAVYPSIGWVEFDLLGQALRLLARQGGPGQLSFVLRDATAGRETYGLARFLFADLSDDGAVTLDFNKAINPPCAFSPYATCPLPPPENVLAVRIAAGELAPAQA